ncbi:hypothetical protein TI04_11330, partial [Achromatium sp. WMS2]
MDSPLNYSIRVIRRAKALLPITLLIAVNLIAQITVLNLSLQPDTRILGLILTLIIGIANLALIWSLWQIFYGILRPLWILGQNIEHVCQGNTKYNLNDSTTGGLGDFATTVQNLHNELVDLYEDMDNRVSNQTRRLAQKTASLKILYEAATSITQVQDLTELLIKYLKIFKNMVNGHAATVRLNDRTGKFYLIACIDKDNTLWSERELLPVPLCECGNILIPGEFLCSNRSKFCHRYFKNTIPNTNAVEIIQIPLQYHNENLGYYSILVDTEIAKREELRDLLAIIGHHLAVAIAKHRSDIKARQLSVIEERNFLAHELHDSLAQTLASLRLRIRLLQESIQQPSTEITPEVQKISNTLDEAHTELRQLLNNFRLPLDQGGLIGALTSLVSKFKQETNLTTLLHHECQHSRLTTHEVTQILRITQEALNNIHKHAHAHTVRIFLRCQNSNTYSLLIEDDGIGFTRSLPNSHVAGEHLGLSIMEERAQRIGAKLDIESEPGE